ncbi:hypothetical protein HDE_10630 [Halotydeus destructor]|nr:hypothetical protein HDE_10630 [Halotydeus destructor]
MVGRIGSILAPFVKELANYTGDDGPMLIFGLLAIGDAILILLFLPETFNKEMPDTLEEVFDGFRLGRFPVIMAAVVIEITAGLMSAMSVSIEMYILSRFLLAFGHAGRWTTGFVLSKLNQINE